MLNKFLNIEALHRKLEEMYVKREKEHNDGQGVFMIEVVDEKEGTSEPLGIVIPGSNLKIESDEM